MFLAEDVREIMSHMGFRTVDEMVGKREFLGIEPVVEHWKAKNIDLTKILHVIKQRDGVAIRHCEEQDHGLENVIDHLLIEKSQAALISGTPVKIDLPVKNTDRSTATMLSGNVAKIYGHEGLPDETISIKLKGSAGQSLGAFLAKGISLEVEGGGNDYVGKGLSGGKISIYPPKTGNFAAEQNIIVGNTVLYGAIEGECYFRGVAGERFAVRNSGAIAVVEGVGDHCCEYMTGGVVVVIGSTGLNFAAGMSGGIAYVLDEAHDFEIKCNTSMVELESIERDVADAPFTEDVFNEMMDFDEGRLKYLISRHFEETNSVKASRILSLWDSYLPLFKKVCPTDFRRALRERKEMARANGHGLNVMAGE
tara:strand:- start:256 stop:1353 length:1098 start_codon:yes stop_codon:yes gene_type:complete